jgi:exportin-T
MSYPDPAWHASHASHQYKRAKKNNPDEPISPEKRAFLNQTLETILEKMKWDEEDDPEDMDEDDLAAFDLLRKV